MIFVTILWSMAGVVTRHLDSAPSFEVTFWRSTFNALALAVALTTVANVLIVLLISPLITALFAHIFLHHRLQAVTWLAIVVAGLGIVWMFFQEGDETFSLIGSLVALAVPLAAAVNFTILQHVGLDKGKVLAPEDEPVQDMLQAVLIGAMLSVLATLPLSWPFQAISPRPWPALTTWRLSACHTLSSCCSSEQRTTGA